MRMPTVFLGLLLAASSPPQERPETRIHPIDSLIRELEDRPGSSFMRTYAGRGTTITEGEELTARIRSREILDLIRANISPTTWNKDGGSIKVVPEGLEVRHRPGVHAEITRLLEWLRGIFSRYVAVDAAIVDVDPAALAGIRAGERNRALLSGNQLRAVLQAATIVKKGRFTALWGQRVAFQDVTQQPYLRDHDVQISTAAAALDPIIDILDTGAGFEVEIFPGPLEETVTLAVRGDTVDLERMEVKNLKIAKLLPVMPAGAGEAPLRNVLPGLKPASHQARVQLPHTLHDAVRTDVTVRSGQTILVASLLRGEKLRVFLLTPTIVAPDPDATPVFRLADDLRLRIYDTGAVTRRVRDYPGPRTELVSPSSGGGPLSGATFTLSEPKLRTDVYRVRNRVFATADPEGWKKEGREVTLTPRDQLVVYQTAEGMRAVDRTLRSLVRRHGRMVTTEAYMIGFTAAGLETWKKTIPALEGGVPSLTEDSFGKLLEAAHRGLGVRLVGAAEVTGLAGQQVHLYHFREESYLMDYEPQIGSMTGCFDPIIGLLQSGTLLDVRPTLVGGTGRVILELSASLTARQAGELRELSENVSPVQTPRLSGPRWRTDLTCLPDQVALAGLATRPAAGELSSTALFVRAREVPLE